nr:hypothetical protein [Rhizobium etli]
MRSYYGFQSPLPGNDVSIHDRYPVQRRAKPGSDGLQQRLFSSPQGKERRHSVLDAAFDQPLMFVATEVVIDHIFNIFDYTVFFDVNADVSGTDRDGDEIAGVGNVEP